MSVFEILDSGYLERDKMKQKAVISSWAMKTLGRGRKNCFGLWKEGNLQATSSSFEVRT